MRVHLALGNINAVERLMHQLASVHPPVPFHQLLPFRVELLIRRGCAPWDSKLRWMQKNGSLEPLAPSLPPLELAAAATAQGRVWLQLSAFADAKSAIERYERERKQSLFCSSVCCFCFTVCATINYRAHASDENRLPSEPNATQHRCLFVLRQ